MNTTPDDDAALAEFIYARVADDQAAAINANGANPAPWAARRGLVTGGIMPNDHDHRRRLDGALWDNEGAESLEMNPATARHIARHDPARALRTAAATCRVVDEFVDANTRADDRITGGRSAELDEEIAERLTLRGCCRHIAVAWADHPDYRQGWQP